MTREQSMVLGGATNLAVIAPIREDMVIGFEPVSYLERLRKVLKALSASRKNVRESELMPPVFPDSVGRSGIIHHFRYALIKPEKKADDTPGVWRLSLNVTFDGGWEPYMRVIYQDVGPLLDLLFCHSSDYPNSRSSSFETYTDWVRTNELPGGTFYMDSSSATLRDTTYLAEIEKAQREGRASDRDIARLALPSMAARQRAAMAQALHAPVPALTLPFRTLKGLYRLSAYFPNNGPTGGAAGDGDKGILRRFAQLLLDGPMAVMRALDELPPSHPGAAQWQGAKQLYDDELSWLDYKQPASAGAQPREAVDKSKLQSHILNFGSNVTHGALVLLRVLDAAAARKTIATLDTLSRSTDAPNVVHYMVGFTHAGLKALGVAQSRLDVLPQEFVDGMEARCALLGDVRGNHPDRWTRPLVFGQAQGVEDRVDLGAVHVAVHLRLTDAQRAGHELHPRLAGLVGELGKPGTGLRVLAVQAMRDWHDSEDRKREHFGFVDGLSQPRVPTVATTTVAPSPGAMSAAPVHHNDMVGAGELFLGYANDRDHLPGTGVDRLLHDGSFLVVRKLRQRVDHLDRALESVDPSQRDEVLAKMMGRRLDGSTLATNDAAPENNDFDYETPGASDACPFHSHVRRTNARDHRAYMPRILRRGMSYGPKVDADRTSERGLMFMAYCASIAEQFEVIQRWVSGGNSTGVGSAQADPFLRVPQAGETSTFRYLDAQGDVRRVQFDDKPLVQLEWGLYLFVPSLAVLSTLHEFGQPAPVALAASPPVLPDGPEEVERERIRQILDDFERAPAEWTKVREGQAGSLENSPYGRLLGTLNDVMGAMKDDGSRYSVQGYGERMGKSIGLNLLGLDPGPERTAQLPLNRAIEAISEKEAFDLTLAVSTGLLKSRLFPDLPSVVQDAPARRPIDLITFSDHVMAQLCRHWIGLPEDPLKVADPVMLTGGRLDEQSGKPRCPGNFATASRYIFSPHPRGDVGDAGQQQGLSVRQAVATWLANGGKLGSLAQAIKVGLDATGAGAKLADNLAGVLLGFPPTVQGNFHRTMETWIKYKDLWQHQQVLFEKAPGATPGYTQASEALRQPLLDTMRKRPVPEMLWRSPVEPGKGAGDHVVITDPKERVVLGITSALVDGAPDELMFGRDAKGKPPTVHGCPGYKMGMGVMLGMIAALFKAGTLAPTGSPVLLILTPKTSAASPPEGAEA